MEDLSPARKWASLLLMTLAMVAAGAWIVTHASYVERDAAAHGFTYSTAYVWTAGNALVAAAVAGVVALFVCALVQRSVSVWGGGPFLACIAVTSIATAFAVPEVPGAIAYVQYNYLRSAGEKGLEKAREANVSRIVQNNLDCSNELDALGFPEFLHAASLGAPHGLENARVKIGKARAILVTCEARDTARVVDFRKAVAALDLPPARKAEALSAVGDEAETLRKRLYLVVRTIIDEAEGTLSWLADRRGRWTTDGDKVMFYDRDDLEAFLVRANTLKTLAEEGQTLDRKLKALDKDKTRYTIQVENR